MADLMGLEQGTLVGTTDILSFVGYISVGLEPTAYALYCSPLCLDAVHDIFWVFYTIDWRLQVQHLIKLSAYVETGCVHTPLLDTEGTEVPVYILVNAARTVMLDLPVMCTRQGHDRKIHVIYDSQVDLANYRTTIYWAHYPSGCNMPVFQFSGHLSDVFSSASAAGNNTSNFGSWLISNAPVRSEGNGSLSAHTSYGGPYSTHSDSHHYSESTPMPDIAIAITTAHSESHHNLLRLYSIYEKS
ncbi:hypothetical protein BDR04DRAFT_1159853 [Suillus decipiens]|nr:hypothetical protein BDR04DRAFT_1159853 [Suillus decipiens]